MRGDRDMIEDSLDLVLAEAVGGEALARAVGDQLLRARARGHALGADADQPASAALAGDRGAEQRVELLRLDARDRRRLVLRVAGRDRDLGAQGVLAIAYELGDVLCEVLGAQGAAGQHDLADRRR